MLFSKQEKVKDYPGVETQVNSALGHINVAQVLVADCSGAAIEGMKSDDFLNDHQLSCFIGFQVS